MEMFEAPAGCTLPTAERPLRVTEFADLFGTSLRSVDRRSPVWLRMRLTAPSEALVRDLTARESACCSFFVFSIAPVDDEVTLDIRVPGDRTAVLDGLEQLARAR